MASKTVWIVGGLAFAVAVGTVTYVSYHESPAAKDAAGTIVEARRAIADNPGSSNGSSSTTNGSNDAGNGSSIDQAGADDRARQRGPDGYGDRSDADGNVMKGTTDTTSGTTGNIK
jgi:hypothetical protein